MRVVWRETVFELVFGCAVGLGLGFVGGPGCFLLVSDMLVGISGHNIVGCFMGAQTASATETCSWPGFCRCDGRKL